MTPYVDAGFLLTLVVVTDGTSIAKGAMADATLPLPMNALHQLQVANLIQQLKSSPDPDRRKKAGLAEQLWRWYFLEEIFVSQTPDWNAAFADAVSSTLAKAPSAPPLLALHVAAAAQLRATHFFSFDPRSRALATQAGMTLLPAAI